TDELTALEVAMQQNMVLQGFKIHERQRQMKAEVDALDTPEAVRNYRPGWPDEHGHGPENATTGE
ncbi:DUF4376 domain-containing protein, partial [Salmonella enterica]|nr:DUF4376 domain-containing protein [Salmonella enterica]EJU5711705.1 hypothetical protein [Salmonella enterica]